MWGTGVVSDGGDGMRGWRGQKVYGCEWELRRFHHPVKHSSIRTSAIS